MYLGLQCLPQVASELGPTSRTPTLMIADRLPFLIRGDYRGRARPASDSAPEAAVDMAIQTPARACSLDLGPGLEIPAEYSALQEHGTRVYREDEGPRRRGRGQRTNTRHVYSEPIINMSGLRAQDVCIQERTNVFGGRVEEGFTRSRSRLNSSALRSRGHRIFTSPYVDTASGKLPVLMPVPEIQASSSSPSPNSRVVYPSLLRPSQFLIT
ncbi:hypothetical protein K438DRAFT_1774441 [Mycena galopus ATCC 62051]|nr:hypothetical protein K438DRAFT_1774441 [Mycena galopus ATCC 62051]